MLHKKVIEVSKSDQSVVSKVGPSLAALFVENLLMTSRLLGETALQLPGSMSHEPFLS